MAEIIELGIVGIKNMGEYDAETNYEKLNVVTYEGSTYCALKDTVGNLPTNTDYWQLYAQKGGKGDKGDTGDTGARGEQGIPGVPGGTPLVANSTSDMTDTTKVYVNATDGYWYYHNGTTWAQGGIYQASQSTDDVENLKDYVINNNLKNVMDWVVGDINSSGIISNAYRIATSSIQHFPYDLYINIDSDTKTYLWIYDNASGANPTGKGWYQDEKRPMVIPAGTYFRLLREYIDTSNPDRVALTNAFNSVLFNRTYIYNYYEYQERLTQAKHDYENIKYNILFNIGEISNGQPNIQQAMNRRILTQNIQCFDFDIVLPKSKDDKCDAWYLVTYTNGDESQYTNVGWCNQNTDYVIPAGTYFRILGSVHNIQSTAVVGNLFTSDIYDYIQIYKTDLNKPEQIFYNNNFNSVAHQGYVTNDTLGHSTVQAMKNAKLHGFNYGECDIKFSSDNVPVCCHDDTFVSNGVTITIRDHTYAELITYNYYGTTIASLDDIVKTCKEIGLGLYIDQLPAYNETQYNIIFSIIDKYEMSNHVKWLTTNESVIAQILNKYNNASIVLVTIESDLTNIIALANNIKTELNHISIDVWKEVITVANIQTIKQQLEHNISVEVWTIDNKNDYKSYLPYVSAITSNKVCYNDVYNDLI